MVDSRKGGKMTGEVDNVRERLHVVEQKLDGLSASVDARFDAVDAALVEQRQYTEFTFDRLASEMRAGFSSVDARLSGIDGRFNVIDGRFNVIDGRFNAIDGRFDAIDDRFNAIDDRFSAIEGRFTSMDDRFNNIDGRFNRLEGHFDRIERKLDRFIDTQSRANELVERRLRAVEPPSDRQ
jgi:hypothetical protein